MLFNQTDQHGRDAFLFNCLLSRSMSQEETPEVLPEPLPQPVIEEPKKLLTDESELAF